MRERMYYSDLSGFGMRNLSKSLSCAHLSIYVPTRHFQSLLRLIDFSINNEYFAHKYFQSRRFRLGRTEIIYFPTKKLDEFCSYLEGFAFDLVPTQIFRNVLADGQYFMSGGNICGTRFGCLGPVHTFLTHWPAELCQEQIPQTTVLEFISLELQLIKAFNYTEYKIGFKYFKKTYLLQRYLAKSALSVW